MRQPVRVPDHAQANIDDQLPADREHRADETPDCRFLKGAGGGSSGAIVNFVAGAGKQNCEARNGRLAPDR